MEEKWKKIIDLELISFLEYKNLQSLICMMEKKSMWLLRLDDDLMTHNQSINLICTSQFCKTFMSNRENMQNVISYFFLTF